MPTPSGAPRVYTGDGNRIRQTAGGVTTDYVLDTTAGLTQVLQDRTETYLYGNSRIAQASAGGTDYFLGDNLGSVRQLTDEDGTVTLDRSYAPFGETLSSQGYGQSSFGYTGEDAANGVKDLEYLRARYMSLSDGRFISKDSWTGDLQQPMSYNSWLYGYSNPIRFTDPSGEFSIEDCYVLPDKQSRTACIEGLVANEIPDAPPARGYTGNNDERYNDSYKHAPNYINWFPTRDPLANGATKNHNDREVNEPGTPGWQFIEQNYGLCGEVSLAAILAASLGNISVNEILEKWRQDFVDKGHPLSPVLTDDDNDAVNYTWPSELKSFINYSFGGILTANYTNTPNDMLSFVNGLSSSLALGQFPIITVDIMSGSQWNHYGGMVGHRDPDIRGGGHWVVITGFSDPWNYNNDRSPMNWVRIYNPFDNWTEYYWWGNFWPAVRTNEQMVTLSPEPRYK